jgi:hypothetical protein
MKIYVVDKPLIIEGFKVVIAKYTNSTFVGGSELFANINWQTEFDAIILGIDFTHQINDLIQKMKIVKEKTDAFIIVSPFFEDRNGMYDLFKKEGATDIFLKTETQERFKEIIENIEQDGK